jgi:hypothetical protein
MDHVMTKARRSELTTSALAVLAGALIGWFVLISPAQQQRTKLQDQIAAASQKVDQPRQINIVPDIQSLKSADSVWNSAATASLLKKVLKNAQIGTGINHVAARVKVVGRTGVPLAYVHVQGSPLAVMRYIAAVTSTVKLVTGDQLRGPGPLMIATAYQQHGDKAMFMVMPSR